MKEGQDANKRKILLIDDDTSLLVTLGDFLEFEGYEVTTAETGEQGLAKVKAVEPDLIILDMSMPGMGGVGFLKEISDAAGKPKYPVLVLTARANMAEFFANIDVDGFVAKPCDPSDLLMEVTRIIFLRAGAGEAATDDQPAERKVLIGEDDQVTLDMLIKAFSASGYIVASASSGPHVLERAIVEKPDCVLVKVILTGMNGDAVTRMLREMPNTREIPVVLYDASGQVREDNRYARLGEGNQKLVNSNTPALLMNAVKELLAD